MACLYNDQGHWLSQSCTIRHLDTPICRIRYSDTATRQYGAIHHAFSSSARYACRSRYDTIRLSPMSYSPKRTKRKSEHFFCFYDGKCRFFFFKCWIFLVKTSSIGPVYKMLAGYAYPGDMVWAIQGPQFRANRRIGLSVSETYPMWYAYRATVDYRDENQHLCMEKLRCTASVTKFINKNSKFVAIFVMLSTPTRLCGIRWRWSTKWWCWMLFVHETN